MNGTSERERGQPRLTSGDSSVLQHAGILLTGSVIGGILVLINEALIAKFLGIQIYGFYALAFMFARVGAILSAFGLPLAVLHFLPINLSQRDHPRAMGTVLGSLLLPGFFGSIFGACVWLSSGWFAGSVFHEPAAAPFIRGLAVAVPFLALLEVLGFLGRGFGSAFSYVFIRNFGPPICYFLVLLYLRQTAAPAQAITSGMPAANIAAFLIGAVYMLFLTRNVVGWVKPTLELKALFSYSIPVSFNLVASLVIVSTDLFLIGVFSTAKVVGLYRACVQLVIPFDLILTASSSAMAPAYSVFVHDRLHGRLRDSYMGANHLVTLLAVPLFFLLLFNGRDILGMFGPEFTVAAAGLSILAFGQLARVCSGNAAVILTMGRKQKLEAANSAIAALFNVAVNMVLIPKFGLIGAAIGTSLSLLLLAGLRIVQIWRVFGLTTFDMTEGRFVVITALIAALSYWASGYVGLGAGTGLGHLIVRFALMGILIAFAIWHFCLDKAERDLLLAITRLKKYNTSPGSVPAQLQKMLPESEHETIPNFFVVGAPRCGTTSLWTYLSSHPQIYMSYQKEPLFFGSDLTKIPGEFLVLERDAYFELFRPGKDKAIRGEASVMYMFSKNAAREIYQCNPKARILICLRNPVDLVYSYYGQLRWGGYEDIRSFDGALEAEADRRMGRRIPKSTLVPEALYYSEIGMLGAQVERYLEVFPREQIHFIMFDDLMKDAATSYLGLLDFLGVSKVEPKSYAVRNPHKEARSLTLSAWFQRPPGPARMLLALVPQPYRYTMLGHLQRVLNTRMVKRESMPPETRRRLQDHFASDIERLGALVGRDLSGWLRPKDERQAPATHPFEPLAVDFRFVAATRRLAMSFRLPTIAFRNSARGIAAVVLGALVFWVAGCGKVPPSSAATSGVPIGLPAVSASGVFDPSLADTPAGARAWMSYSAVDPSPHWPDKAARTMTTRLAYSDDSGATWHDLGAVINPISETVDGPEQRTWSNEVSSLVFDPAAPADAQWKLFWHHYSAIGEDRQFQHGWIAYKHAATPEGLRTASEIKLLGGKAYDSVNDDRSGSTGSPLGGEPRIRVAALGDASDCIALSEPGAMATAGGIYLAVGCYSFHLFPPHVAGRVILLKCTAPCDPGNAGAWRMVGTLLGDSDADSLDANGISASDLFMQGDKAYLMVSPVGSRPVRGAYQGCYVFQFSDLDSGKLERANGKLKIAREIHGTPGSFNGACTYAQNVTAAGFLYGEIKISNRAVFQIYKTRRADVALRDAVLLGRRSDRRARRPAFLYSQEPVGLT